MCVLCHNCGIPNTYYIVGEETINVLYCQNCHHKTNLDDSIRYFTPSVLEQASIQT